VGPTTNAVVSGLIDGVTYFFAVTAYNALGLESDFSAESFVEPPDADKCSPSTNFIATASNPKHYPTGGQARA
jgi:hypothetical protein